MNAARPQSRLRQRGIATAMAAIFLIAAVIFALSQTLTISGANSIDNVQQMDSVAALFLAESGLQRGQGTLTTTNPLTNLVCTGIAGGPYSLGRGTFTLSATSTPASCDNSGATLCTSCAIQSVGTVGSASRTIQRTVSLAPVYGIACNSSTTNCTTVSLTLKNPNATPAVAIFSLATQRQGNGDSAACDSVTIISGTTANCYLAWNVNSANGGNSVGGMGAAVTIAGLTSATIHQTLSSSRNYAEVGTFFPGSGSGPAVIGTFTVAGIKYDYGYWDDTNPAGGGTKTVGKTPDSIGQTNDGTATNASCTTTPALGTKQACTNWCYGGDTLVFGFAGHSTALTDQLHSPGGVIFNTAGTPAQNIGLSRLANFPTSSNPGAPTGVDTEIWYAHNYNLSPTPVALNASSYKGNGTGAIGATFTARRSSTTLTVTAFSVAAYPLQIISPGAVGTGDVLGGAGVTAGTITAQLTSTEPGGALLGGRGTYTTSSSQTLASQTMTASSKILHVTACTICFFAPTDAIQGTAYTISSQSSGTTGNAGNYVLSGGAATIVASAAVLAGTPNATIYLRSTESTPAVTTPATRIAIFPSSGTGLFAANTTVTATQVPATGAPNALTNSFTVSPAPTTPLSGATVCGGTCAFFDHAAATTTFTIDKTGGTGGINYWAAGFTCLSGADQTPNTVPISSTVQASSWSEVVQ